MQNQHVRRREYPSTHKTKYKYIPHAESTGAVPSETSVFPGLSLFPIVPGEYLKCVLQHHQISHRKEDRGRRILEMEGKEGERVKRGRTRLHSGHREPVGKIYTSLSLAYRTLACTVPLPLLQL